MKDIKLYNGDCLEIMKDIASKSVDMILCDLPYNTTSCKWDKLIPSNLLWEQYERIIKDNGAIVLFGTEPFSSKMRLSNEKLYKYDWKWIKSVVGNFLNCKNSPLKKYEDIMVFSKGTIANGSKRLMRYNPQGLIKIEMKRNNGNKDNRDRNGTIGNRPSRQGEYKQEYTNYPVNILEFSNDIGLHPTQKPVALLEYLIKTYTNDGDTILDNCMGSGSTGVACINTNRKFIGIELDENYFNIAKNRIENTYNNLNNNLNNTNDILELDK